MPAQACNNKTCYTVRFSNTDDNLLKELYSIFSLTKKLIRVICVIKIATSKTIHNSQNSSSSISLLASYRN